MFVLHEKNKADCCMKHIIYLPSLKYLLCFVKFQSRNITVNMSGIEASDVHNKIQYLPDFSYPVL
jgi:hypothetical protein